MKKLKVILAVMAMACATVLPAQAQFKYGVKAGVNVSDLHFDKSTFDSSNRTGVNVGLMTEFTVPVIGLGFDLSAMYVRRNSEFMVNNSTITNNRDYFEIPLNLKYKFGLPVVGNLVSPFITTGPSVAFLCSKTAVKDAYKNKDVDWAWNFGIGVELLKHVQVAASYGLGLTKAVTGSDASIEGKNRYWTVTAAYLF